MAEVAKTESEAPPNPTAKIAWSIGLGALLPFAAIALGLVIAGRNSALTELLGDAFRVWSLAVLSFLGGIRWGMAMIREESLREETSPSPRRLVWPVLPAVFGWAAMFLPQAWAVLGLLVAYCAMGAWDSLSAQRGEMPAWYGNLRIVLTLLVAAAHAVAFAALA